MLSGFLITYLLLAEEERTNNIGVKKFYIRRILRIWPLYLLIILSALFILPYIDALSWPGYTIDETQANLGWKLLLYVFFFANLVLSFFGIIPFASQAWSIGTEEQFYLVWPLLIKHIKKNRLILFVLIIIFYNIFYIFINSGYSNFIPYKSVFKSFTNGFAIDNMAIGGLLAYLLYKKHTVLKIILNRYVFFAAFIGILFFLINPLFIPYFNHIKFPILFGIVIINLAANEIFKNLLENKLFNYLGNISYGLYMFHPIGITLGIKTALYFSSDSNIIIYPISILISIIMAATSYKYFESYFLKFKHKFTIIKSGSIK